MRVLVALDGHLDHPLCRASAYLCEAGRDSAVLLSVVSADQARETMATSGAAPMTPMATQTGTLLNMPPQSRPRAAEARDQAVQRVVDGRTAELNSLARRYFQHVPVQVAVEIADDVAATILAHAEEIEANGIAVGARKQSSFVAALLGSVAADVLRRSPVPVLVVREDMPTAAPRPGE